MPQLSLSIQTHIKIFCLLELSFKTCFKKYFQQLAMCRASVSIVRMKKEYKKIEAFIMIKVPRKQKVQRISKNCTWTV